MRELKRQLKQAEQQTEIERKERERLEVENEDLQTENEELNDRLEDIPKSEESKVLRSVNEHERKLFYKEFADDLSYIVEKYGSIIFDGDRLKEFGSTNEEYANKVNKFDDFWKGYVKSIIEDVTIIDMEVK